MLLRRTPELVIEETGAGGHVVEPNGGIRVGRAKEGGGAWRSPTVGSKEPKAESDCCGWH
jgi:hypothetical protein